MLRPNVSQAQTLAGQEPLLLDYLQRLERHRAGRQAVHIHISGLRTENRREHHIRMAAATFDNLVRQMFGQLFLLNTMDMMFVFKSGAIDEVEAAIVKLRFMFSDDPLIGGAVHEPESDQGFLTWYDLEDEYGALIQLAQRWVSEDEQRRSAEQKAVYQGGPRRPRGQPLTPEALAKVEITLGRADLTNLMRRQAISAVVGKAPPQAIFNELFISIGDLRDAMLPDINLNSSPWLFQQLTETLDRRVLSLLNRHEDRTLSGDISINLNVATLLSPDFLVFDDNVKAGARGTIVIELQKVDIFADLGAYMFARDFAHERGYRICIDGLSHQMLPFVDRERLGADLIKLIWQNDMPPVESPEGQVVLANLQRAGVTRLIMCRVDDEAAVEYGHSVGITLYQGRYIENLLVAEQKKRGNMKRPRR